MNHTWGPVPGNQGSSPFRPLQIRKRQPRGPQGQEWPSGATGLPGLVQALLCLRTEVHKRYVKEVDFPMFTKCCILSFWARPGPRAGLGSRKRENFGLSLESLNFGLPQKLLESSAEEAHGRKGCRGHTRFPIALCFLTGTFRA